MELTCGNVSIRYPDRSYVSYSWLAIMFALQPNMNALLILLLKMTLQCLHTASVTSWWRYRKSNLYFINNVAPVLNLMHNTLSAWKSWGILFISLTLTHHVEITPWTSHVTGLDTWLDDVLDDALLILLLKIALQHLYNPCHMLGEKIGKVIFTSSTMLPLSWTSCTTH